MPIKRRITKSPLRKKLQQLADMEGYGNARNVMLKEGSLPGDDEDRISIVNERWNSVEVTEMPPTNDEPKATVVMTADEYKEMTEAYNGLYSLAQEFSNELYDLRQMLGWEN